MNIHLYQIWYDDSSKPTDDSGFLAFDVRQNPEFLKREIAHLMRFYNEIVVNANDNDYFALLSPRFFEKTGLTERDIKEFLSNNPNNDVYLFNPYPMNVYLYLNVWEQGEEHHSELKQLTQNLLNKANIDFDIFSKHRNTIDNTVYCNYWVGSKQFFDNFVAFLKKLDGIIDNMPNQEKNQYFKETTYFRTTAIFYPFIFERLICLYLKINDNIKVKPYTYQDNCTLFQHSKRLHRKFYFGGYREKYDRYERKEKDLNELLENFGKLNHFINPKFSLFPFKFMNRWINSIIKKINVKKFDKFFGEING